MSIYLTRVDQNLSTFGAQCEFKLVGKNGQVVFSQSKTITFFITAYFIFYFLIMSHNYNASIIS